MVFTPVLNLEAATVKALVDLEWTGPLTVVLQRDNPAGKPHADHLRQYQRGRELFLRGWYDAMLVIEDDVVPPPDTLQRLVALDGADVAYGLYMYRGGGHPVSNILERYYTAPNLRHKRARNVGEPLTERGLYRAAVAQGVIQCSGSGLGCVLIRRRVLEAIPFQEPADPGFFDTLWTQQVYQAGYRMMADMAVRCGHVNRNGAGILWPPS